MNSVLFITTISLLHYAEGAKILGIFPAPGYSQFILAEVLMKEVANRGHQVTVISPYKPKSEPPNYRTILTNELVENKKEDDNLLFELDSANLFVHIMSTYEFGKLITDYTLRNKEVQALLHSNEQFDLVIVEHFFNDALKGFATHFKAPLILFSSMGLTEWNKWYMGIPQLPSINSVSYTSYTNRMKFFQRIRNVVGTVFDYFYRTYKVHPIHREFLQKYFPKPMDYDTVVNNASLMFLNSHVTTSENVLLPCNMIEIGGFHVIQGSLSKEVQDYLDKATDGAVLFSLGTNLKSSDLSPDILQDIFTVFGNMKEKILWKLEKDLPKKPNNVFISKWLNQRDILAHPNVKLFITHGGMLSTTEAIFHGVPMVGIPVFGDQKMNMARAKKIGIANVINFRELSEKSFFAAVNETLTNPKYRENVKKMSSLLRDRAVKPLDLAMYWIEYVIRHKGIRFEVASFRLYWFEFYMIDILVFMVFSVLVFYLFVKKIVKFVKKQICKSQQVREIKQKRL